MQAPSAPVVQQTIPQNPPALPVLPPISNEVKDEPTKSVKNESNKTEDIQKECTICKKPFATATKLSRHMKTHSPDQPFKCKICNKAFSHSGNYKIHLRMHTDERPFKCVVCNKGCRQAQDLEKHMRTHTGTKHFTYFYTTLSLF